MIAALWVSNFSGSTMLKAIVENWFRYDSVFVVIASVALLIVFVNSKIKCGKGMKKYLYRFPLRHLRSILSMLMQISALRRCGRE